MNIFPTILELSSGRRWQLDNSFVIPLGLPGVGGQEGRRAPDSRVVQRSGDNLPTAYTLTVPGKILGRTATETIDELCRLSEALPDVVNLWRGSRAYLSVAGGVLPEPIMGTGWLSAQAAPIFYIAYLAWRRPDGTEVYS